ncbi:hypothetical protein [Clostridium sp.]
MLKLRIEGLEDESKMITAILTKPPSEVKGMEYSGIPSGKMVNKSVLYYIDVLQRTDNMIFLDKCILDTKEKNLKEMNDRLKNIDGLDKKIIYMKEIQDKNLREIADELGYSYDHIRRVHSKNKHATICATYNL